MAREEAERVAAFCIFTGRTRAEFYEMTLVERNAFVDQARRIRRR